MLAAWPNRNNLAEIAEDRQTTALCVVPWAAGESDPWQAATSPELLDQAAALTVDLSVADPVVVQGLKSIFVNQSNMLASSDDRDRAVARAADASPRRSSARAEPGLHLGSCQRVASGWS
ncbi:MAG: hypothetical protein ACRCTR_07100 [Actinomycetota bacterium]